MTAMTTKLVLSANDKDEELMLIRALQVGDILLGLWTFQKYLRSQRKYAEPVDDIEKIEETFWDTFKEYLED